MDLHGSIFTGMAGGSGMERLSCIMHGPREREKQRKTTPPLKWDNTKDKRMLLYLVYVSMYVCISVCMFYDLYFGMREKYICTRANIYVYIYY